MKRTSEGRVQIRDTKGRFGSVIDPAVQFEAARAQQYSAEVEQKFQRLDEATLNGENVYSVFDRTCHTILEDPSLSGVEKADILLEAVTTSILADERDVEPEKLIRHIRHEVIPELIGPDVQRTVSREIGLTLRDYQELSDSMIFAEDSALETTANLPPAVAYETIERLADLNLLGRDKDGNYTLGKNKKSLKYLLSGDLETAQGWLDAQQQLTGTEAPSIDEAKQLLEVHDEKRALPEVVIETHKPGFRIAPINALRIGHQDYLHGLDLVEHYVDSLNQRSADEMPDVFLVSDLTYGDFKHTRSGARSSIAEGHQSMNVQYHLAKQVIDRLKSTGVPVVVNLGENDYQVAHDMAIDAVRELREFLKDAEKNNFVHFGRMWEYSQDEAFQKFKKFSIDYAIPFCMRYGRRLRTADELGELTDGMISKSEFMCLFEHIKQGRALPSELGIDPDDVRPVGEWNADRNKIFTDDCEFVFHTQSGEERILYQHVLGLTANALAANPMTRPVKLAQNLGVRASSVLELPTAIMTGQQQEGVMGTHSKMDIISNPGLTDPMESVKTRAYYRRTTGDTSLRAMATRGRLWTPGIYEYGHDEPGVVSYVINDRNLMERSGSMPRMVVISLNDFQIGSPTARPDLVIKALALVLQTAEDYPVAIHGEGDFVHGFIYPNMSREAQAIGLMDLDSQAEMLKWIIEDTIPDAPKTVKDAIFDILWQQGNHDEEQKIRVPTNHSRNVDSTVETWRRALGEAPGDPNTRVNNDRVYQTANGAPVPSWIGRRQYGAYNMAVAHYHLNKKMYKGGAATPAVYDAYKRLEGMGIAEDVQILSGAHHHNRQFAMVNGIWIDIGDALADQSEFENMLGLMHSNMSVKMRFIGGGKAPVLKYYTEEALARIPIKYGPYTEEALHDQGYHDDEGADLLKYSMYSLDGQPRTAAQKRLWDKQREASQWAHHMASLNGENEYDDQGKLIKANRYTENLLRVSHEMDERRKKQNV